MPDCFIVIKHPRKGQVVQDTFGPFSVHHRQNVINLFLLLRAHIPQCRGVEDDDFTPYAEIKCKKYINNNRAGVQNYNFSNHSPHLALPRLKNLRTNDTKKVKIKRGDPWMKK